MAMTSDTENLWAVVQVGNDLRHTDFMGGS